MKIFEWFQPVKPGYFDWEIVLVDNYRKPIPEKEAKEYWAKKYGIDTYNDGIEAAAKWLELSIGTDKGIRSLKR